jgi:hypothetical protein
VNESGGSDQTGDVLAVIPEIIALKPKAVILNIGRNNICNSVPYASQYASIVSQLQTANITVYHMLPIFETACDQTALTNYINSTYPAANIFDTGLSAYSATPTVVLAEGVHPSPFGETLISSAATAFLWSKGTYSSDQKYGNLHSSATLYQRCRARISPVLCGELWVATNLHYCEQSWESRTI